VGERDHNLGALVGDLEQGCMLAVHPAEPLTDSNMSLSLHQQVYRTLREQLITGRFRPGRSLSMRGVSEDLGIGVMPAREAINRLVAENALEVKENRRVCVPVLSVPRLEELTEARRLLEPVCARKALPRLTSERIDRIVAFDASVNASWRSGDAEGYMLSNYNFHFEIYRAAGASIFVPLLEGLWALFGPTMRQVYEQGESAEVVDKHAMAIEAIRRGDAEALAVAIEADILDGIHFLRRSAAGDAAGRAGG
jgi:DNA-binding GntR family transcriptional regulator